IYGAAPDESAVTLQARKPASLIVRGSDGSVYFARQMAPGQAYRVPVLKGLTVDVSDPLAFDVFVFGQGQGVLQSGQTPVAKLAARAVAG
ncbi:MAG TPA: helix-turn-helix domain-containing protein, partial [Caulobacteraceae bacterium]